MSMYLCMYYVMLVCICITYRREKDERFVDLSVGLLQREEKRDRSTGYVLLLATCTCLAIGFKCLSKQFILNIDI